MDFSAVELCAGGGGQALGLELAGFRTDTAVEIESHYCATLRLNRPHWRVLQADLREIRGSDFRGIDLLAAGVPCPPFSVAGKQLGKEDERDLFPEALRIVREAKPAALMLENVAGFAHAKFSDYRNELLRTLEKWGYRASWRILNASDFGVVQLRPRFVLVAMKEPMNRHFAWPAPKPAAHRTVGTLLRDLMAARKWPGVGVWVKRANGIAPTIVGGSKKHGGPDLGPSRAKKQWLDLCVDGMGIADEPPGADSRDDLCPRLTVRMVARIQSFPDDWVFVGGKTWSYRQVGNAFPPLVAKAVGESLTTAFESSLARR